MKNNRGDILVSVLIFAAIAVTMTIGMVNWGASMLSAIRTVQAKEQAFQIAEAGIDYYRWHLAQSPTDYSDGTTTPGPYYHTFYDKNDNVIGQYSLTIAPPPLGSTKVVITSTATTTGYPNVKRIIQATLAEPSLAQYAVVANDQMVFGAGTTVNGPITSNRGIHFDGVAHNIISSALATDTDPDNTACHPYPSCAAEWGVWTAVSPADPQPPTAPNNHNGDVFLAGRQSPVPAFPFGSLTVNLSGLHTLANSGVVGGSCTTVSGPCWKASGSNGYYIHLNTNNTYDIYKVTALQSTPGGCTNDAAEPQWGVWSYKTLGSKIGTYQIPSNGVIFVEDNLWIDGANIGQATTTTRVTIAAAANVANMSSTTGSNIIVGMGNDDNLTYARYDGTVEVGLIAQANVSVALDSVNNLEVDAALVAESGRVGRNYYNTNCSLSGGQNGTNSWHRNQLTLNGMIATDFRYGFQWQGNSNYNCGGSVGWIDNGYCTRNLNYDANLLYGPPPSFPLASTQYRTVSWKQIQ